MAEQWYCRIGDRMFGPMAGRELKQLAGCGKLNRTDAVRRAADTKWTPAEKVKGLFDSATSSTAAQTLKRPNAAAAQAVASPASPPPLRGPLWRRRLLQGGTLAAFIVVAVVIGHTLGRPSSTSNIAKGVATGQLSEAASPPRVETAPHRDTAETVSIDGVAASVAAHSTAIPEVSRPLTATGDAVAGRAGGSPMTPEELFRFASPAVVTITAKNESGEEIGGGSGFLISPEAISWPEEKQMDRVEEGKASLVAVYVATNYHVIERAIDAAVKLSDGSTSDLAWLVVEDKAADIAILRIWFWFEQQSTPAHIPLADDVPPIASSVCAIGSPLGLDLTISPGIVSGIRKLERNTTWLQTTAPISPGSSGGPLLSMDGKVVGLTTAMLSEGQNLNFAVSVVELGRLLRGELNVQPLWKGKSYRKEEISAYALLNGQGMIEESKSGSRGVEHELLRALALCQQNRSEDAVKLLRDADGAIADDHEYLRNFTLARAYLDLLEGEWESEVKTLPGDIPDATAIMYAAVRQSPHFDDAIKYLDDTITANPSFSPAHYLLAFYRTKAGQWAEGLIAADKLVSLVPGCSEAYVRRGRCYEALDRWELAANDYEKATQLDPRDASLLYDLACVQLHRLSDYEAAIASCQRSIAEGSDMQWACHDVMARSYAHLGNYDQAEAFAAMALKEGLPKDAYYSLLKWIESTKRGDHND